MNLQNNPFKENRTEQMKDLWKYYVPISPIIDESVKPLVVEGGRGSGKTMLFMCNSWREKIQQFKKDGKKISDFLSEQSFIGLYYRVDTAFVSAMKEKHRSDWSTIFETYLGICFLREILNFLIYICSEGIDINDSKLVNFINNFSSRIKVNDKLGNLYDFLVETENYLNIIEDIINCNIETASIRYVVIGRFLIDLCNSVNDMLQCKKLFKIFIDEYETLQIYQQRIVNTLIKHSAFPVVINIGLRLEGMKTNKIIAETETIESPHDYERFIINSYSINNYSEILKEICRKRIQHGKEAGKIPVIASDDIETYLGKYSIEDELQYIVKSKITPGYIQKLKETITNECRDHNMLDLKSEYISELCDKAPFLNSMIHYLLLKSETAYKPNIQELYNAYKEQTEKYKEWIHNRKFGAIFLLAKNYHKSKMYYGFDVFVALSSGVFRYFLELCEQAFNNAFLNSNFNWDGTISIEEQSNSTKYVSKYKVDDINDYVPYGKELRIFVQYLGQIFSYHHTSDDANLGEPEPNHFFTDDLALTDSLTEVLSSAIMCNVLQEKSPTKRKQAIRSSETVDYYLNKIYTPYFNISYRDKRKIRVSVDILTDLLSGNDDTAKKSVSKYLQRISSEKEQDNTQGELFDPNNEVL